MQQNLINRGLRIIKKYINTKTVYQAINDKLENNKIELQQIKNNIDVIQENIKRRKQKINEYQIKCETWKRRIIEFDDMQKKILPAEKISDNLKKVENAKKDLCSGTVLFK